MKQNNLYFFCIILLFSFIYGKEANAEIINTETQKTPISIEIKEKTLFLKSVTIPTFLPKETSNVEQKNESVSDLRISVQDNREGERSPWTLYYQVGQFVNGANDKLANQKFMIEKGTISASGKKLASNGYQAYDSTMNVNEQKPLVKVIDTAYNSYEYYVSKENVSLIVPANATQGLYTTTQLVVLMALPEIE